MSKGGGYVVRTEFQMFHPYAPVTIDAAGATGFPGSMFSYSMYGERQEKEIAKWTSVARDTEDGKEITIQLRKADFDMIEGNPFRMKINRTGDKPAAWRNDDRMYERLISGTFSPDSYVFIIPKQK